MMIKVCNLHWKLESLSLYEKIHTLYVGIVINDVCFQTYIIYQLAYYTYSILTYPPIDYTYTLKYGYDQTI